MERHLAVPRRKDRVVSPEARAGACGSTGTAGCTTSMGTRPRGRVEAVAAELAMIAFGTTRDAVRTIFTTEAGW